jgi:hypothetical protein
MISKSTRVLVPNAVVVAAAELAQVIGTDLATINNWIRRGIIGRTSIGGRQVKSRLFSKEEVYKTALKYELVKLGIQASPASEAVNTLWRDWDKKDLPRKAKLYAIVLPGKGKLTVALGTQKRTSGPLYKYVLGASKRTSSMPAMDLPQQAFVMIPISDVLDSTNGRLSELLLGTSKGRFSRA